MVWDSPSSQDDSIDVIIVGAGWAGMAAADSLARANVSFRVLEASNRTGGRSRAVEFGDRSTVGRFVFEQGSNWVSGAGGGTIPKGKGAPQSPAENPVFTLAKQVGVKMVRIPGSSNNMSNYYAVYDTKGQSADPVGALRHWANQAYDCLNRSASTWNDKKSWNAREALKRCAWNPQTDEEWAVDWALTVDDPGFPAKLQSLFILPDQTYQFFGPDDWFVIDQNPRGFARMIDAMVRDSVPPGDERVLLNTEVTKIAWSCDGIQVRTKDGRTFSAKELISTLPLGVLQKRHKDIFEPNLPQKHADILTADGIVMGNLTHVLLQFPHVWWDNSLPRWISSNPGGQKESGEFSEWQNLNHDSFVPGSQTLLSFLGDPQSSRYEGMSDADAKAAVMRRVRQQHPSITIPDPTDFFISRHGYDPLSYGAYSGCEPQWRDRFYSTLTAPLQACGETRVRFGGEAMCDNLSGFTHGAYQSGKEIAAWYLHEVGKGPNPKHDDALQLCDW